MRIDQLQQRLRDYQEELTMADGRPVVRTPSGPPTMSVIYMLFDALQALHQRLALLERSRGPKARSEGRTPQRLRLRNAGRNRSRRDHEAGSGI